MLILCLGHGHEGSMSYQMMIPKGIMYLNFKLIKCPGPCLN